jgi:hypothetical protein
VHRGRGLPASSITPTRAKHRLPRGSAFPVPGRSPAAGDPRPTAPGDVHAAPGWISPAARDGGAQAADRRCAVCCSAVSAPAVPTAAAYRGVGLVYVSWPRARGRARIGALIPRTSRCDASVRVRRIAVSAGSLRPRLPGRLCGPGSCCRFNPLGAQHHFRSNHPLPLGGREGRLNVAGAAAPLHRAETVRNS